MPAEDHAILVGISRYPGLGDLRGPERDARRFRDWLTGPGGVPEGNAKLILSSCFDPADDPFDAEPTVERVNRAFDRLVHDGRQAGGRLGRRLYIYLAGHGFAPSWEDSALLTANAARGFMGYHIPGRPYARWFLTAAFFEEVVLLMDCCRDDYRWAVLNEPPWDPIHNTAGARSRHYFAFATEWSRKAREKEIGDQIQGVFTTALLAGLEGGAADDEGRVTGHSLAAFIYNYLPRLLAEDEYQEPRFDYDPERDLLFASTAARPTVPVRVRFERVAAATPVEVLDNEFQVVGQTTVNGAVWKLDLPPGRYMVTAPGAREIFDVLGGGTLDVRF